MKRDSIWPLFFEWQESYQVRVEQMENSLQVQAQEHLVKIEELHKEQNKVKNVLCPVHTKA